jgi:uncharacterized phage protein (TIGR01671 family)
MKQREIKFRAWHKTANEMLIGSNYDIFRWQNEGQDIIIMQSTGLTDKNGKEIYEGDILKGSYTNPLLVVYDNGAFCFENNLQVGNDRLHQMRTEKLEIIGNIYETPELLNENS